MLGEELKDHKLFLASKSPRRKHLLSGLDLDFEFIDIDVEEIWPEHLELFEIPEYLACLKSQEAVWSIKDNEIVITADTAVFLDDAILNKPKDEVEAAEMLAKLSGKKHTVITGVCIASTNRTISFSDQTNVYFDNISDEQIDYYIKNYKPFDKAGSYGVQDWLGYVAIKKLEGSYYNVMGLPVSRLYRTLIDFLKIDSI